MYQFKTIQELRELLIAFGISLERWGVGETKTIEHLFEELTSGEATLRKYEETRLLWEGNVSSIHVFHKRDGKIFKLHEVRQVFKDNGRVRVRNALSSVSEKMKPQESPQEAAVRALEEELGITEVELEANDSKVMGPSLTKTYPGLTSVYTVHFFTVFLNDTQYKPEGYVEEQKDKFTYFEWREE